MYNSISEVSHISWLLGEIKCFQFASCSNFTKFASKLARQLKQLTKQPCKYSQYISNLQVLSGLTSPCDVNVNSQPTQKRPFGTLCGLLPSVGFTHTNECVNGWCFLTEDVYLNEENTVISPVCGWRQEQSISGERIKAVWQIADDTVAAAVHKEWGGQCEANC